MIKKYGMFYTDFTDRQELLSAVSDFLLEKGAVTDEFKAAILKREEEFPTGLPSDPAVAIPHTDGEFVLDDCIVTIVNKSEIEFIQMGGDEDDLVYPRIFFVLVLGEGGKHLKQLQGLILKIQEGQLVHELMAGESESNLLEIINQQL